MNKKDHIAVHVMGLFQQYNKIRFDINKPEDAKLLERWLIRLSQIPDDTDLIDKCFEPLYDGPKMPQPDQFLRVYGGRRGHNEAQEPLSMDNLKKAANTPWRKSLLKFLTTPGQFTVGTHNYYIRLAQLAKDHNKTEFHAECLGLAEKYQPQEAK